MFLFTFHLLGMFFRFGWDPTCWRYCVWIFSSDWVFFGYTLRANININRNPKTYTIQVIVNWYSSCVYSFLHHASWSIWNLSSSHIYFSNLQGSFHFLWLYLLFIFKQNIAFLIYVISQPGATKWRSCQETCGKIKQKIASSDKTVLTNKNKNKNSNAKNESILRLPILKYHTLQQKLTCLQCGTKACFGFYS